MNDCVRTRIQRSSSHFISYGITAAAFVAYASVAAAQTPTPATPQTSVVAPAHWTVTPFIGFGFSGDLDSATPSFGAAGGYMWNDRIALEAEFNSLPSSEAGGLVEVDTNVWSLTGNLLYHFAGRQVVPYGVLGMGIGHSGADVEDTAVNPVVVDDSSTTFVMNLGGGVERQIANRVAIRGDFRYFFGNNLVPDFWRPSIGLSFDLGRQP
jgi:opacity protein-like surface antigen